MPSAPCNRLIRKDSLCATPWKNGGGETTEIIVSPESAGLDDFDWRLSMARVERDGAFSLFPGIDRTLAILHGSGLRLTIGTRAPEPVTTRSGAVGFDGALATHAHLLDGPVLDLNIMTRRSRFHHKMTCLLTSRPAVLPVLANHTLLLAPDGGCLVETGGAQFQLGPLETLHGQGTQADWRLLPQREMPVWIVEIFAIGPGD